jgi:hypothetical protein
MAADLPNIVMPEGQHLIIPSGALVFYIDDSGDEKFNNCKHPFLAFGGVGCTCEFHIPLARIWQQMKALTFPQVRGPLHASRHLRDRSDMQWSAVLAAMNSSYLGRFGVVLTDTTQVPPDQIAWVALRTLANRFANITEGMLARGLWRPPARVFAIFENSPRLTDHIEEAFNGINITIGPYTAPIEGYFMPKSVANPFLEMADCVANAVTKCVKHQRERRDATACTPAFQTLFRDFGPPLASYIEVVAAASSSRMVA